MWQDSPELGPILGRGHPAFANYCSAIHIELAAEGVAKSVSSCQVVIPEAVRGIFDGPRSLRISLTAAFPRQVLTSSDLLTAGPVVFSSTPAATSCATKVAEGRIPIALDADQSSHHSDLAAASQSGMWRAFFCVPIIQEIESAGPSTSDHVEIQTRCLGTITVGFPRSAAATQRDLESALLLASALSEIHGGSLAILASRLSSLSARDAHPIWGTAGGLLLPHAEEQEHEEEDELERYGDSNGDTSSTQRRAVSTIDPISGVSRGPQIQTLSGWKLSFSSPEMHLAYEQYKARQRKQKDPIAMLFLLIMQVSAIFFTLPSGSYGAFFSVFLGMHELVPAVALLAPLGLLATRGGRRMYSRRRGGYSGAVFLAAVWQCASRGKATLGAKSASPFLGFLFLRPTFLWIALVGVALQVWPPLMLSVLTFETLKMDTFVQCSSENYDDSIAPYQKIVCWGLGAAPVAVVAMVAYLLERKARLVFCATALGATWAWYHHGYKESQSVSTSCVDH